MATQVHLGHIFHLTGAPLVTEAADALVSVPDGALVIGDDGRVAFCGERSDIPPQYQAAPVSDHRPGFLLPGFVDTHVHFPQTYAGASYGGGQLLEWLTSCIYPSESRFAEPSFAQRAAVESASVAGGGHHRGDGVVAVFISAFSRRLVRRNAAPRPAGRQRSRHPDRWGPRPPPLLITSEEDAIRLAREEIDKWHAADTGDREHRAPARRRSFHGSPSQSPRRP